MKLKFKLMFTVYLHLRHLLFSVLFQTVFYEWIHAETEHTFFFHIKIQLKDAIFSLKAAISQKLIAHKYERCF